MKNKRIIKITLSILCSMSLLACSLLNTSMLTSNASGTSAVEQKTPEELGYERVTLSDFSGMSGGLYTQRLNNPYAGKYQKETLEGKYLDIDITSNPGDDMNSMYINYAGMDAGGWLGLRIMKLPTSLGFATTDNPTETGLQEFSYQELGITSTEKFNLKVAVKKSGNDLLVDVWVNNTRQKQMTFTGGAAHFGSYLGIAPNDFDMTVGIPVVTEQPEETPVEQKTPEELGYERVTLSDFSGMSGGLYAQRLNNPYAGKYQKETLEGKYLDIDITSSPGDDMNSMYIDYAGMDAGGWLGLRIMKLPTSLGFVTTDNPTETGLQEFLYQDLEITATEKFNLKVAVKKSENDLLVDVWVNNTRQKQMTFTGGAAHFGSYLGIAPNDFDMTVGIPVVTEEPEETPVEQKTPEELGYEKVTIGDFGLADDTYVAGVSEPIYGAYQDGTLDGKYLDVDITANAGEDMNSMYINYAGNNAWGWLGLRIMKLPDSLGFVTTNDPTETALQAISYSELEITATERFNLKVGTRVDGTNLIVDVWVKDVRQAQMTFVDGALHFGTYIGIMSKDVDITLDTPGGSTLPEETPVEQKTPEELGFERITLEEVAIADGTYEAGSDMAYGDYLKGTSLDGKYLDVNITTAATTGSSYINYAGNNVGGWYGFRLTMLANGMTFGMAANEGGTIPYTIKYSKVDMEGPTDKFNLKMAVTVEDSDVIAEVWINEIRQTQMRFKGCASEVGNFVGIYAADQAITVETPGAQQGIPGTAQKIDGSFKTITFSNFKISDGTYAYANKNHAFLEGIYGPGLHKTVFSGDILLAKGADLRYGGNGNGWWGLRFWCENGKLYMSDAQGYTDKYVFLPSLAGVEFADKKFNLKISVEYVDSDEDGVKNDVKLGVWLSNRLYKNKYIFLKDYVQHLGTFIGVYSPSDGSSFQVSSSKGIEKGVDFTIFGCTKNWKKELGVR